MKPARCRGMVKHLRGAWRGSVRRACAVLRAPRSSYHHRSRRGTQAELRQRIREIAETRVRYDYRRIHVLLRREGWTVNAKRVWRLYRQEGLQLRSKTPKRKVSAKLRQDRAVAGAPNEIWAMDFLSDQLFDGTRIRVLTIVDACSRISPAIDVRRSYRGADVVETLERVVAHYGLPRQIRLGNGPEFISRDLDLWADARGVVLDFSRPGRPTDNALAESFNGKVRAECLNTNWFLSLDDARLKCEAWRVDYDEVRPHSSIGHRAPMELAKAAGRAHLP
jgi:putative transposase